MSFFFFKQTTAYEERISDWSSDVCSSDLHYLPASVEAVGREGNVFSLRYLLTPDDDPQLAQFVQKYCGAPSSRAGQHLLGVSSLQRSEERRVGNEWVSTGRSRWSACDEKHKYIHRRLEMGGT